MARRYRDYGNSRNYGSRRSKRGGRADQLRRLAYNMGQVQKGLNNPDSQISASYDAGLNRQGKQRKPLF